MPERIEHNPIPKPVQTDLKDQNDTEFTVTPPRNDWLPPVNHNPSVPWHQKTPTNLLPYNRNF